MRNRKRVTVAACLFAFLSWPTSSSYQVGCRPSLYVYMSTIKPDGTSWCVPCAMFYRDFWGDESFANSIRAKYRIVHVNADEQRDAARRSNVSELPAFICGTYRIVGYKGKAWLAAQLNLDWQPVQPRPPTSPGLDPEPPRLPPTDQPSNVATEPQPIASTVPVANDGVLRGKVDQIASDVHNIGKQVGHLTDAVGELAKTAANNAARIDRLNQQPASAPTSPPNADNGHTPAPPSNPTQPPPVALPDADDTPEEPETPEPAEPTRRERIRDAAGKGALAILGTLASAYGGPLAAGALSVGVPWLVTTIRSRRRRRRQRRRPQAPNDDTPERPADTTNTAPIPADDPVNAPAVPASNGIDEPLTVFRNYPVDVSEGRMRRAMKLVADNYPHSRHWMNHLVQTYMTMKAGER